MKKFVQEINMFLKKVSKDNIEVYSGEAAFFMILSFIPFIMLLFSLIQFSNVNQTAMNDFLSVVIPDNMIDFFKSIVNEVYSKSFGTISASAIIAIWCAGRGFYSMCKGFKAIYRSNYEKGLKTNRVFTRIESLLFTVIFIITVFLVMISLVFGDRINHFVQNNFEAVGYITKVFVRLRIVYVLLVLFLVFLYLYKLIANRKMRIRDHIPGAIFAAIGWYTVSRFFSIYVYIFTGFTNMYGSLSTIVLIMMWIYACIFIIFLGAEINSFLNVRKKYKNRGIGKKRKHKHIEIDENSNLEINENIKVAETQENNEV